MSSTKEYSEPDREASMGDKGEGTQLNSVTVAILELSLSLLLAPRGQGPGTLPL